MKNISLILNGILLVAVAFLYYLHFAAGEPGQPERANSQVPSDIKIAYINADTVLKYYDFFNMNRQKLETKGKQMDQEFRNRAQSLQNDINAYQRNLGSMTIGQAKAVEEDLGKKQQNLQLYQRSLEQEIMNEQAKMNEELYAKITAYLKQYGQAQGLDMVLKFDPSSDLLYGGDALDITQQVIKGLNETYKQETATAKAKADSAKVKK
jgi:outer membrane protein